MQEQTQATGTWRIGFDLAAFVLLATVAGMAAAVTLASIALLLSGALSGAPAPTPVAPVSVPSNPANPGTRPTDSRFPAPNPSSPAVDPARDDVGQEASPAVVPAVPASAPGAPEVPGPLPSVQTQLARTAAPVI